AAAAVLVQDGGNGQPPLREELAHGQERQLGREEGLRVEGEHPGPRALGQTEVAARRGVAGERRHRDRGGRRPSPPLFQERLDETPGLGRGIVRLPSGRGHGILTKSDDPWRSAPVTSGRAPSAKTMTPRAVRDAGTAAPPVTTEPSTRASFST